MSDTKDIFKKNKITRVGTFKFDDAYRDAHSWLDAKGYDVEEKKYDERTYANGKQFLIIWEAERKIDEYSKFGLKIEFFLRKIKDVSVQVGDGSAKMQEGEFNMTTTATLVTDYDSKWEAKPFFKFMQGFYEKYLYRDSIARLKSSLWDEGWEFINEVKALLNLYKYM